MARQECLAYPVPWFRHSCLARRTSFPDSHGLRVALKAGSVPELPGASRRRGGGEVILRLGSHAVGNEDGTFDQLAEVVA